MKKTEQLQNALLSYLKVNKGISLGEDTFLVTGGLDGSDKCYGFINRKGEILVITRQSSKGYPVSDMDKDDLDYLFTSIFDKILEKSYKIVNADSV